MFQLFQSSRLLHSHSTIFFSPAIVGLVADGYRSTDLAHGFPLTGQHFGFSQFVDNVFRFERLFHHFPLPWSFQDIRLCSVLPLII